MQPEGSPGPVGERPERGAEEAEGKRPPNTGARLWGRVRSKLLRQKVPLGCGGWGRLGGMVVGTEQALVGLCRIAGLGRTWWFLGWWSCGGCAARGCEGCAGSREAVLSALGALVSSFEVLASLLPSASSCWGC